MGGINQIKEAIGLYNQKRKVHLSVGVSFGEKMTQKKLALIIFKDRDISDEAKAQLMGACIAEERKLSLSELRTLCKTLDTTKSDFVIGLL